MNGTEHSPVTRPPFADPVSGSIETHAATKDRPMLHSITEIQALLDEITKLLGSGNKGERRKAVAQLQRIAAIASTAALTLSIRS